MALCCSDMSICGAQSRMRSCGVQQSVQAAREEASPFVSFGSDHRHPVSCPMPRRMPRQQVEPWNPSLEAELLDVILAEGTRGCGSQVPSSPPYFCGSPPSRAANPLVLDARFGEENASPSAPLPMPAVSAFASSSTGSCNKGCVRKNLGASPVAVRIEGFDCLDRGRRRSSGRSSIPSVA
ncbi:hypothetical protein Taro_044893 [Colocasia esculenta]|uniref:Uncharacterized protein n=1 Tax=Colocasia esculenta TaxID=4460 RepID=A0A843WN06_COLES|nr:hypothetical protein [Colocasia esculenta]